MDRDNRSDIGVDHGKRVVVDNDVDKKDERIHHNDIDDVEYEFNDDIEHLDDPFIRDSRDSHRDCKLVARIDVARNCVKHRSFL